MEKNRSGGKQEKSSKESKKKKDKGEGGPKKAEITVMINEQQAMKIIQNSKVVITVQDLARQTGVKISAANAFSKKFCRERNCKKNWWILWPSFVSICFFIDTKYVS